MRRHPNPPGCAVAGALARHSARRAASTPASRRDARLLPRAGTDLSARRHRRGRARGRTRRPAPRIPRAGPGPVATSDGRRRSRRPRGGPRVDGRTEPPSASAAPNATLATRVRDATSATLAARVAKPRTAADPRAQGHPTRSSRTDPRRAGGSSSLPKKKIAFLISVDRFFSRRLALHHARRRPPSGHTRVVRRVPHDRLGRDRAGDVQQHLRINVSKQPVQLYRRKV